MSTPHFLSNGQAQPPVLPTERWLQAFPAGQWGDWGKVSQNSRAGDTVWVSTSYPLWLDVVAQLLQAEPRRHVVVVSATPDQTEGLRAINAGAKGYCHLYAVPELLQEVARVVEQGGLWVGPELLERIVAATRDLLARSAAADQLPAPDLSALSAREAEVAQAVAAGKSNREVAEQLFISERTVKAHLGAVFEKLGVRDRLQLALRLSGRAATRP
ncbi:MAG TPA: response regulator transcription factor, partial [Burkholderiaceae bacterium]|nr:response regulator transcription factor [Burkholderiaceae bacterium]